ncbi:MAG: PAS domain-containing protein, partial [Candidatus Sumerlaeia bacterium]|nr:PAS domain-containing protein [Candidatus Sumerlaeia bacterium]
EFRINFQGRFILIRYFAVRDARGEYLGCIEVTQDITEIRNLSGEKRLL